jgi:Flp pilus assembly protein TadB
MFDFKALDTKKLITAAVGGILAYVLLAYIIPGLLSVGVVAVAGALVVAYLIYTYFAKWELQKLLDQTKDFIGQRP